MTKYDYKFVSMPKQGEGRVFVLKALDPRNAKLIADAKRGQEARAEAKRQAAAVRLAGHVATVIAAAPVGLTGEALAEWMRETRPFCDWDARRIARVVKAISII